MIAIFVIAVIATSDYAAIRSKAADAAGYSAVFNAKYYAAHNPDVVAVYGNGEAQLLNHFINYGMSEGRQGNEEFNVQAYRARYEDLRAVFGDNLKSYYMHYINYGKSEGRNARAVDMFSAAKAARDIANGSSSVFGAGNNNANVVVPGLPVNPVPANDVASYYDRAVFVGDSIMVGYRNYALNNAAASAHNADFLANVSYSLYNAFAPVTGGSLHPTYAGQKRFVWESISMMDVDRVFIFFGTNELVGVAPDAIVGKYKDFIANIQAAKPGIEIHIISMTPVYSTTNKGCLNNTGVNMLNALLVQMCQENGYGYVGLHDYMMDETGAMNPIYSSDRYVHCNNAAYANVWEAVFQEYASTRLH